VECPQVLREAWATLMNAGHEPSPADWAHYHDVLCVEVLLSPHADRPGALMVGDPTMCRLNSMGRYRCGRLLVRVMEHVGGWMWRPLPLVDMVYEVAALRLEAISRSGLIPDRAKSSKTSVDGGQAETYRRNLDQVETIAAQQKTAA
jgi:hypothetical protein